MARKFINPSEVVHDHDHESLMTIKDLQFGYTKKQKEINGISMEIHNGEWTTVLGPNGSGKSTLVKLIMRIAKPQSGEIFLKGMPIRRFKTKDYARSVAYIPQIMEVPEGITVYDFVAFGRNPWLGFTSTLNAKDKEIIESALVTIDAFHLKDKMMEEISGGQRQRVLLALAIAQTAEVIILDEPTTYLDIKAQYEVLEVLSKLHAQGKTIVTVLHDINQAVQYSDELVVLNHGTVYAHGEPESVVTEKMLREVYGVQTKLYTDENNRKYVTDIKIV